MVYKTKRAAFRFDGMMGAKAEKSIITAALETIKGLTFVGIISDRRGCMMVCQRGGLDIRLQYARRGLCIKLQMPQDQIKIVKSPIGKNEMENITWSRTDGTLRLGGPVKMTQAEMDDTTNKVYDFDPGMIFTDQEISTEVKDLLCCTTALSLSMIDKVCVQDHYDNTAHICDEECPGNSYSRDYNLIELSEWDIDFCYGTNE